MQSKIALIVVFNHKYVENIEKLERIYRERFTHIYYLMPFYQGSHPDVIPVYENSYFFQGYIAQAFKYFYDQKYTHYCFVADDLFLNPCINESNYAEYLGLTRHDSFIPEIHELHHLKNNRTLEFLRVRGNNRKWFWGRTEHALTFSCNEAGLNLQPELPSYSEANILLARHRLSIKPLRIEDVHGYVPDKSQKPARFCLQYPLVASYSDIVVVSSQCIDAFCHYCGVFAAAGLFVELAIPTALALIAEKIVTQEGISKWGKTYWLRPHTIQRYQEDMHQYRYKITRLLQEFPHELFYIHPVKLSQWTMD